MMITIAWWYYHIMCFLLLWHRWLLPCDEMCTPPSNRIVSIRSDLHKVLSWICCLEFLAKEQENMRYPSANIIVMYRGPISI